MAESDKKISSTFKNLSISSSNPSSDDSEDLPDDIKNLIQQAVTESTQNSQNSDNLGKNSDDKKKSQLRTAVTGGDLEKFFDSVISKLQSEEFEDEISKKIAESEGNEGSNVEGSGTGEKKKGNPETKLQVIRKGLEELYNSIWEDMGVDALIGKHAITNAESFIQKQAAKNASSTKSEGDKDSSKMTQKEKLDKLMDQFTKEEHKFVGSFLLGKEEYKKRQSQKDVILAEKAKLQAELESLSPQERGDVVMGIKAKGFEFRQRLLKMSQIDAANYVMNPSEEDAALLQKMSALTLIMQENQEYEMQSHGHSHGGEPCTGHGHSHEPVQSTHGHSHGGKPCTGHGHAHEEEEPEISHGHSHGGKPCTGHGHSH